MPDRVRRCVQHHGTILPAPSSLSDRILSRYGREPTDPYRSSADGRRPIASRAASPVGCSDGRPRRSPREGTTEEPEPPASHVIPQSRTDAVGATIVRRGRPGPPGSPPRCAAVEPATTALRRSLFAGHPRGMTEADGDRSQGPRKPGPNDSWPLWIGYRQFVVSVPRRRRSPGDRLSTTMFTIDELSSDGPSAEIGPRITNVCLLCPSPLIDPKSFRAGPRSPENRAKTLEIFTVYFSDVIVAGNVFRR